MELSAGQQELKQSRTSTTSKDIEKDTDKSPEIFAFCSYGDNYIKIVDIESKKELNCFQGVTLAAHGGGWASLMEIQDSELLCSLNHNFTNSAAFKIFNLSRQGKAKEIFATEEIQGIVGDGFIAYNAKRSIIGILSVGEFCSYHLITLGFSSCCYSQDSIQLSRKVKWFPQYSKTRYNIVTDLDFHKEGKRAASVDSVGTFVISDIDTNNYINHYPIGGAYCVNRCRWMPEVSDSLLFAKYNMHLLNVVDVEKNVPMLKSPIKVENKGLGVSSVTHWIDVCPSNQNLLASAGTDKNVKIFDRRESKIVKILDSIHSHWVSSVRWSANGEMLLTASWDRTVKLLDFNTGKVLRSEITPDRRPAMSACFFSSK